MGAETIKIEPLTGDPTRVMSAGGFAAGNRGKQSVSLDATLPESREMLLRMLEDADVLVEGFRPGVMARLGLSFEDVKARNPHILYASISAYGHTGPYASRPAHDVNTIAAAGYFAATLSTDHDTLQRPRIRIADYLSGMYAGFTLSALLRIPREQRQAQHIDASMFDAMAYVMLPILQSASAQELVDPTLRNDVLADVALYRTACGRGIAFATLEDKFWKNFVASTQHRFPEVQNPLWAKRGGRTQDKAQLAQTLTRIFAQITLDEVEELMSPDDVCWSPILNGTDLLADPHLAARGLVTTAIDGPATTSAVEINGMRAPADGSVPALGEHTTAWRERLGMAAAT